MPWRNRARSYQERMDAIYEKLIDHAMRCKAAGMDTQVLFLLLWTIWQIYLNRWACTFVNDDKPEEDQRRMTRQFSVVRSLSKYSLTS